LLLLYEGNYKEAGISAGPAVPVAGDYFAAAIKGKKIIKGLEGASNVKPLGGAYKDVPANGGQVHHMPAKSVSPLSEGKGPGIRMETPDHMKTQSWGRGANAEKYRAEQEELIKQGKFKEAQQMDIDDVRSKFGDRYDEHIKQMQEYTDKLLKSKGGLIE